MLISLIFIPLIALLPDASYKLIQSIFWPSPIEYLLLNKNINPELNKNQKTHFSMKKLNEESKEISK